MNKEKAVLIIHPITGPATTYANWFRAGYKMIVLYPPLEQVSEYFKKGLMDTDFEVKLFETGDLEKDIALIKEQQQHYDIVYGYMGWETNIPYGEEILRRIFPDKSNDPSTSFWRYNKYAMNERLRECGLTHIKQIKIVDKNITPEVHTFLKEVSYPLVVKPSFNSAASEDVYFCDTETEVLSCVQNMTEVGFLGKISEIIIQEKVVGMEYFIDFASYAGQHRISTIFWYERYTVNNRPIYRALNVLADNDPMYQILSDQIQKIITALGINYGFSHTEVMVTQKNEIKLLEVNFRPSGLGGYINDVVYEHKNINQFSLMQDLLNNKRSRIENDGETYCMYMLNNPGLTYKRVKVELLNDIESYRSIRLLKPSCEKKPEKASLADSVAILHLANISSARFKADKDLLEQLEKDGTLFEQ